MLRNVRSEPEEACIALPTLSVSEQCSKVIVELTGRTAGPVFVCPPRGECPAFVMKVY